MAELGTQRVVLFSSPHKMVEKADGEITQSYSIENRNVLQSALDSGSDNPRTEISFKVSCNESLDDSGGSSPRESTQVIWTYHTLSGASTEVAVTSKPLDTAETEIEENSRRRHNKKIDGDVGETCRSKKSFVVYQRENISQTPTLGEMKKAKYSAIQFENPAYKPKKQGKNQEDGNSSIHAPENAAKSGHKTSYTYKIQEGVAILQHAEKKPKVDDKPISQTSESEHKHERKRTINKEEDIVKDDIPGSSTGVESTTLDTNPINGPDGVHFQEQTKRIQREGHTKATTTYSSPEAAFKPELSFRKLSNQKIKTFEASPNGKHLSARIAKTDSTVPFILPPRAKIRNSSEWITYTTSQEEAIKSWKDEGPSSKLSTEKIRYYQKHDSLPNITLHIHSKSRRTTVPRNSSDASSADYGVVSPKEDSEYPKTQNWTSEGEDGHGEKPTLNVMETAQKPGKLLIPTFKSTQDQQSDKVDNEQIALTGKRVIPDFSEKNISTATQQQPESLKVNKINAEQWITQTIQHEVPKTEQLPQTNKLSVEKMQFLQKKETEKMETAYVSSPGKVLIPDFNLKGSCNKDEEILPPSQPKSNNTEEWITLVTKQEEVPQEPALPSTKFSVENIQFPDKHEEEENDTSHTSPPGKIVIPDFNQESSSKKEQPPLKIAAKLNAEQWITTTMKQADQRSDLPSPTKKLSIEKMQFLQGQEIQRDDNVPVSRPGKLVIPDLTQESSVVQIKTASLPPKQRISEECITQTTKQEVKSDLPFSGEKVSLEKIESTQDQQSDKVDYGKIAFPGKLVIPDFTKKNRSTATQEQQQSLKVNKLNAEQWITQTIQHEVPKTEQLPQTNKLSVEKMQFLQNKDTEKMETGYVSSPGKVLIPDFNLKGSCNKDEEILPPLQPKLNNTEEWITPVTKQEEVQQEPALPSTKFSVENIQFPDKHEQDKNDRPYRSPPGKIVIPVFNQESSSTKEQPPLKIPAKLNAEQWITTTIKQADQRSDLPSPTKKLSIEKMQFLQGQEVQRDDNVPVSRPGKLVIPDLTQESSVVPVKTASLPPKQRIAEECITQTTKQEVESDLPFSGEKVSLEKIESTQDQQSDKVDYGQIAFPGKLVIPDFSEKNRSTAKQEQPQSLKVNKITAEQWIAQTIQHEVPKTEQLPQTNKLSVEKMQFLQNKDTKKMETGYVSSPGKVLIPDINLKGSSNKDEEILPPSQPKSNNTEEWITPVTKQEKVQQEPALPSTKFSVENIQFPDKHEQDKNDGPYRSPPGKIVIPVFNKESSSTKEQPPLKIPAKLNAEQWITTTIKRADQRSDLPSPTKKLSIEKMQFLQGQEVQRDDNVRVSRPGKLVIPDLTQESSVVQVKTASLPPKQRNAEECLTQATKQEVESDLPFSVEKVSLEKIESTQDQQSDKVDYGQIAFPGKLVIPDFSEKNRSTAKQEQPQSLKVNKITAEQWIAQTIQHEVPKTEQLPQTNKLSVEKMQFLQNKDTKKMETGYVSSPGKVLIPDINLKGSSNKDEEILPPSQPKSNNTEEWITPVTKQEKVQQEPALPSTKFSVENIQFPDKHEQDKNDGPYRSPPGKIVIPVFNKESSSTKEQPPLKIPAKLNAEQWITTTIKRADQRSDLPSPTKKLSIEKMQFLQGQEVQRDDNVRVSRPGKLVIPDLTQESSVVQVKTASLPPKQRNAEECLTQATKQEVESDLPFSVEKVSLEKIESTQDQQSDKVDYGQIAFPGKLVIPDFSEKTRSTATQEQPQSVKVNKINAEQWITHTIQHEVPKTEQLPQTNKLSVEKMQFLQNKETENMETAYVSSPGKLLIPDFNLKGSCTKDEEILPPSQPKSNNTEEWITRVTKQEKVEEEPALPSTKFSVENIQFPDKHEEDKNDRPHMSPPGKIVIPDFNQDSSFTKEHPPLKIPAKLNAEQWITTTIKQADQRSDLPSPTKKLSIEKMQFLHGQEVQRDDNVRVSRPGKLVIPDLTQESSVVQVKTASPPPKQRIAEECITQTTKKEVESDLPFSGEKVSLEKIESTQDQQSDKVDYGQIAFPGKLVIPDFSEKTRSTATQEQPQSVKVNKINAEQWITHTMQHEVPKTEQLRQTNKLSVEKMQFLQNKETENIETAYVSSLGKVLIPDFNLKGSCTKDEEILPPSQPKSNNTEEWITRVTKQEKVEEEPALPSTKFSVENIHFPDKHEEDKNDRPHMSPPGKIVIPDFNQDSSFTKEHPPLKIPAKLNAEQWITTTIKQADQRSDLPSPTKKLSIEKMQFLQGQEVQRDDNVRVSRPGKLVIPDLTQESSVVQVKTASLPPKQRNAEECITQATKQEVESDLPFSVEKVSLEKIESTQDQQSDKVDYGQIAFPGKLVIPDFSEKTRSTATQEQPQSLKVNKINAEQWITQTIQHEVPKTEQLPQTNKLSVEKMQFLQNKETDKMETAYVSNPGKVLIPDFNLKGSCTKDEEILPSSQPKSNNTEEWITRVTKQEEVEQEPALPSTKFSVENIHFPDKHEEDKNDRPHMSPPGKIVIPDFNQDSSFTKEHPPLKIPAKLNAEQWITTTIKQADQRSDLPSPTKKLSIEKMQFLQGQEVQRDDNVRVSRPGKLVIPDLTQESSVVQVKTASLPPKQRNAEECLTQATKQEVESDLPFSVEKVSLEKIESTQDQQSDKVDYGQIAFPGKLVIPDFSEKTRSTATQEQPQSVKVNKINAEQWITHTMQHEVPKTEQLRQTNKLSVEKMQFLQNKETENIETAYVSSLGKVLIPDFNLKGSCTKDEEILPPSQPKSNNTEEWITRVTKQEKVEEEPALPSTKFSVENIHFPDKHEEDKNDRPHMSPPGKIVIPDFNQDSSFTKEHPPLKIPAKLNAEQWITTTIKQADQRSDLPSPTKKLSIEKMQFLQGQEVQRDDNVRVSRPGKLVIPDLTQESSVVQVKTASPPPKRRIAEECITQTTKQEVESDLPFSGEKVSLEKIESTQDQQSDKVDYGQIAFPGKLVIPDFSEKTRSTATQEQPQSLKVNKINAEQWITQTIQHEVPKTEQLPQTNKLSVEKMQFLQNKETDKMETAYVSNPGKVLIPDFNLKGSCTKDEEILPSSQPKSNNTEEWITRVTKQEEVEQEPALPSTKFSVENIHFPDKHEEDKNDRPHMSPPGKIVIPDFNQDSSFTKEHPPLKIPAKLNAEQWITTTIKQADQRSDLPSPTKKLSIEKMQFLQGQEVQRDDNVRVSRPGKLVIPDLTQESSVVQVKTASLPPKQRNAEECITQATKQEVESDLPFSVEKVSLEKIESTQDQQSDKVDYGQIAFPGKLVIPDFSEKTRSTATQEQPQSVKVNKINAEQWITQTIQHEVPKTEQLPQTNKLSVEKMQFLQNKETENMETAYVSSPGKLLITDFNLKGSCTKDEEILPPSQPKSNNTEEWITRVTKQEKVEEEPALPSTKFSVENIQFPDKHEEDKNDRPHMSPPRKIVIPDFNQDSSFTKEHPPLKIPAKLNAEQWITTTIKQADQRSDLPSPTKKLSIEKMQFLQGQEVQRDDNVRVSRPGKLVITDLTQESSVLPVKTASLPPKQRIAEEWITQTTKKEVQSDLPFSVEKVSLEKIESTQDQQSDKVDYGQIEFRGKLVIPDFSEKTRSTATQEQPQSLKVNMINAEQWITQTIQHEVPKTEQLPQTNKLSVEKMQFLQNKETEKMETAYISSPGKVLITDFNLKGSCTKDEEILPPSQPKSNNTEEWITPVTKQEEVQQQPALPSTKFSVENIQFPDKHEEDKNDRPYRSPPGKIVIPDFNQESSSTKEQPPLKIPAKLNAEQWLTTTIKQADQRSDLPSPTKILSIEKMQFLQGQEVQRDDNVRVSRPGKLVIPDLTQESSVVQVKTASLPPKQRIAEECITQTTKQEVESDLPFSGEKVSLEKIESTQDQQSDKVDYGQIAFPGKLVIPDFSGKNRSTATQGQPQSLKVNKINAEQWITQTIQHEVPKTEQLPQTNKLSVEKIQFLQNKETEKMETAYIPSPGKVLITDFNLKGSCSKDEEILPPSQPKSNNTEEWITRVTKEEEVQQEPALPSTKFSVEKFQFPDKHEEDKNDRPHRSPPGKIVIPDFNQDSSFTKEHPPLKIPAKLNAEQWITTTIKQADQRSDLPSSTKKLSIEKMQFLQGQEVQRDDNVRVSSPGKLVISNFAEEIAVVEVTSSSPPPESISRSTNQRIFPISKQEGVQLEPLRLATELSTEKIHFVEKENGQNVENAPVGTKRMPDVNQHSSFTQVQEIPHTIKEVELQESHTLRKCTNPSPRKLVIPNFGVHSLSVDVKNVVPPHSVGERHPEQGETNLTSCGDWTSGKVPETGKLPAEKFQCFQVQDAQTARKAITSIPGKVVIPNFDKGESSIKVPEKPVNKLSTEQWITQVVGNDKRRSLEPFNVSEREDNNVEKMKLIFVQGAETATMSQMSEPGKFLVPDFDQDDCQTNRLELTTRSQEDSRYVEQQTAQSLGKAENGAEISSSPTNKLSALKLHFINTQDAHSVDAVHDSRPGKIVIPDFNQNSSYTHVHGNSSPPKGKIRQTEDWLTHSMTLQELRTIPLPVRNKLSEDKMQLFQHKPVYTGDNVDVSFPGKIVLSDNSQRDFSKEEQEALRPSKLNKGNSLKLIFEANGQDLKGEEISPLFGQGQDVQTGFSAQSGDIPNFSQMKKRDSVKLVFEGNGQEVAHEATGSINKPSSERAETSQNVLPSNHVEEREVPQPTKLVKRNSLKLVFEADGREVRPEVTRPIKKLSAERLKFSGDAHARFSVEEREVPQPTKLEKRNSLKLVFEADGREIKPDVTRSINKLSAERLQFPQTSYSSCPGEEKDIPRPSKVKKRNSLKLVFEADEREEKPQVTRPINRLSAERLQFPQERSLNAPVDDIHFSRASNMEKRNSLKLVFEANQQEVRPDENPVINRLSAEKKQFYQDAQTGLSVQERRAPGPSILKKSDSLRLVFGDDQHEEFRPIRPITRFTAGDLQFAQDEYTLPEYRSHSFSMDDHKEHETQHWFSQNRVQPKKTHIVSTDKLQFVPHEIEGTMQMSTHPVTGKHAVLDFDQHSSSIQVHKQFPPPKVGKINAEEWMTHSLSREEIRSLPLPSRSKLSEDKVEPFNENQRTR